MKYLILSALILICAGCAMKKDISELEYQVELLKIRVGYHHPYPIDSNAVQVPLIMTDSNNPKFEASGVKIDTVPWDHRCWTSTTIPPQSRCDHSDNFVRRKKPEKKIPEYPMPPEMYIIKP